jgi:type VI secretion system VgrG family protein
MAGEQRISVSFDSEEFDKIASNLFHVTGFDGVEAISEPFRFDIDLISDDPDIDLELLVGKAATLEFSRDDHVRKVHGVISIMEQGEETQFDHYSYKAVLVPRLWMMSLGKQNQIYQEKSVPEIFTEEILHCDLYESIVSDDLDNRMDDYPKKEYVVQYKETDLNFISRQMEHEGIFYYFDHEDERDKIVFCDENSQLDAIKDENTVSYVPASGLATFEGEAIHRFRLKQTQISSEIILKDFNYRKPHVPLEGSSETGELGFGKVSVYGEHFKDNVEGDNLSLVRSQEELCKQKTCVGTSDAILFETGKLIEMVDHYRDDLNREYILTRIHHRGGQAIPGVSAGAENGEALAYQNDFNAIPSDIEFRPARKAVIPKLYGIMSAIVDGELLSDRAQIDEQGRYKVLMPFDVSGSGEGKASRWVRKAEPYGGQGTGMHFPLLKGAEVIWSCIDGDPDRPIITGVVPNPLNKSVVSAENSTTNKIVTPSGIEVEMFDGNSTMAASNENTEHHGTKIGNIKTGHNKIVSETSLLWQQQQVEKTPTANTDEIDYTTGNERGTDLEISKKFSIKVPSYRESASGPQSSYFRIGCYRSTEKVDFPSVYGETPDEIITMMKASEGDKDKGRGSHEVMSILKATKDTYGIADSTVSEKGFFESDTEERFGIFEFTEGAKLQVHRNGCFDLAAGTSVTYDSLSSDKKEPAKGDSLIGVVLGDNKILSSEHFHYIDDKWVTETWEETYSYNYNNGHQENIFYGKTYDYCFATKFEASTAVSVSAKLGIEASMSAGLSSEVKLAGEFKIGAGLGFSLVSESSMDISGGENSLRGKEVILQYEPPAKAKAAAKALSLTIVGGAMAAMGGMAVVAKNLAKNSHGKVKDEADKIRKAADIATIAGLAVGPAAFVSYGLYKLASKLTTKKNIPAVLPYVKVTEDSVILHCGISSIVLNSKTGVIDINGGTINLNASYGAAKLGLTATGLDVKHGTSGIICNPKGTTIYKGSNAVGAGVRGHSISGQKIDFC